MRKPPGYDQLPNSVLTALDAFRQGRYRSDLNALRALASNPDWAWTKGQIHTWITDSELPSNVKTPQRYYKIIHADGFLATHGLITNSKKRGRGGKLANHAQITADGLSLLEMMDEHIARGVLAADQPWSMNNTLASIATELMDTPLREWRNGLLWRVMHVVG